MAILSKKINRFLSNFLGKKSKKWTEYNFFEKQCTKWQNFAQKEKLGQIRERERERERERTHSKGQIFMHMKSQNYKHICPLLNSRSIC